MKTYIKKHLKSSVRGVISFNKSLKDHTTFKIGGTPAVWVEPRSLEDLMNALRIFSRIRLEPLVIGNGSNILIYDGRLDKAVIRLSAPYFKSVEFGCDFVICGSGHSLSLLIKRCIEKGLSGLEGLAGIPGTLGGVIAVNAGASARNNIGDIVEWVRVIDYKGKKISLLKKERLKFRYRNSNLTRYIILEVKLALKKRSPGILQKISRDTLKKKRNLQEYRYPNAGCIFKNPQNSRLTSGQILELCGLKGLKVKGAEVSTRHANFIINKKDAHFKDVISLMKLEQDIVKKNCGINLEPEIKIIR